MKKLATITSIICITALISSCGGESGEKGKSNTEELVQTPRVKVEESVEAEVAQKAEFTGSIEAYSVNNIAPSMGLRIEEIRVDVGDVVKRGQIVAKMDQSQYLQTLEQLENLKVDFERMAKLYEQGGISKQQLDQLETQVKVSQHSTDNLKENTILRSPIAGIVTEKLFEAGDMYSAASGKILTVMEMNRLLIVVNVPDRYYPEVKTGMGVDITLDIYPGQMFSGKVSKRYPSLDPNTRTFKVEITVQNAKLELRPGMMCRVEMAFGTEKRVLVPDIAVLKQSGSSQRYLFVIDTETMTAERREVEIGQVVGNKYEIIKGVGADEMIVVAGMQRLIQGDKVEIIK